MGKMNLWAGFIRNFLVVPLLFLLVLTGSSFAGTNGTLQKLTVFSRTLDRYVRMNVYLPPGYDRGKTYPVLFIVHGMYADEDSWMPNLGMNREADALINDGTIRPLIIVAPDMGNSFGLNSEYGRYEDYFCNELVPYIDSHFSTDKAREDRFIGGLSMGGFIALYIAFTHTDMFGRVGAHSPALYLDDTPGWGMLSVWLYPNETVRKQRDPICLAQENDLKGLKVYLDCGEQDKYGYCKGCKILYDILQSKGVESENHASPGGHEAGYWMRNMDEYLLFYAGRRNI